MKTYRAFVLVALVCGATRAYGIICTEPAECGSNNCDQAGNAPGECGCNTCLNTGMCGPATCSFAHATSTCSGNTCGPLSCSSNYFNCNGTKFDGCEVSGNTTAACGGCTACNSGSNNTGRSCVSSGGYRCSYTCASGWTDCDASTGQNTNGCETHTSIDLNNCGGCGAACTRANATPVCSSSACDYSTCNANYYDCDGSRATGCEALGNTVAHCGGCAACDSTNSTGASCVANGGGGYKCAFTGCAPGYTDCSTGGVNTAGCETHTDVDTANCGACGTTCDDTNATATACAAGLCAPTCAPTFAVCSGDPKLGCLVDLQSDVNNCGACGTVCPGPVDGMGAAVCVAGACTVTCSGSTTTVCGTTHCIGSATCCQDTDCTSVPDCHVLPGSGHGTCSGPGGSCSYPNRAEGAKCDSPKDNLCSNHCQGGACIDFLVQATCPLIDCHGASGCDSATGDCVPGLAVVDGTPCGGSGCFTSSGGGSPTCLGGACMGTPKDCTSLDTPCEVGTCNAQNGACIAVSKPNGASCTSPDGCVVDAQCNLGVCSGTQKECTTTTRCREPMCTGGTCGEIVSTAGKLCSTGDSCISNETCNAAGDCVGTGLPDGTPCTLNASCAGDARCLVGACVCAETQDAAMVTPVDMSVAVDMTSPGGSDKDKGCSASGSSPSSGAAIFLALLAGLLRRPRRRDGRPRR